MLTITPHYKSTRSKKPAYYTAQVPTKLKVEGEWHKVEGTAEIKSCGTRRYPKWHVVYRVEGNLVPVMKSTYSALEVALQEVEHNFNRGLVWQGCICSSWQVRR